jgi:endonuclease YncB( thermonuclease family)
MNRRTAGFLRSRGARASLRRRALRLLGAALVLRLAACPAAAEGWKELKNCELIPDPSNDGDSFHVRYKRRHYIFRLYFVDAPETDRSFPDRLQEQAAYWEIDPREVVALGAEAREFTLHVLRQPFTVYTKRQDAQGRSDRPRYFAFVKTEGGYLSDLLVSRGLARVYGADTDLPDKREAWRYWGHLRVLEKAAKRNGLGAWKQSRADRPGPSGGLLRSPPSSRLQMLLEQQKRALP